VGGRDDNKRICSAGGFYWGNGDYEWIWKTPEGKVVITTSDSSMRRVSRMHRTTIG
jgi:hypothetical protein